MENKDRPIQYKDKVVFYPTEVDIKEKGYTGTPEITLSYIKEMSTHCPEHYKNPDEITFNKFRIPYKNPKTKE